MVVGAVEPMQICDSNQLTKLATSGHDLYIGEIHGTVETPKLVRCLVEKILHAQHEPLTVSLEMPESARDLKSQFWFGDDGRSSKAMWSLVEFLLYQEHQGYLALHFQDTPEVMKNASTNIGEEIIGNALNSISNNGQLLAFGGSFHSGKAPFSFAPDLKPAGMFVGSSVTHVYIEAIEKEAWACVNGKCGIQQFPKTALKNAKAGALIDGSDVFHDYIYVIGKATASPPQFIKKDTE